MTVFFDTDVILDVATAREPFCHSAAKALSLAETGIIKGFTSATIFINVFYMLRKLTGREKALRFLKDLELVLAVLPTDSKTDIESLPSAVKWGKFIQEADNPDKQDLIDRLSKSEEGIMSADAMLRTLNNTDWRWIEQGKIFGDECDRITGLHNAEKKGIELGERNRALSAARKLLAMKLGTREQIAQAVGLPLEEVEKLAAEPADQGM